MTRILLNLQVDCEATQHGINDPLLGERAIRGLGEMLLKTGMKGTFAVIPSDLRVHADTYWELELQGHEIGLHVHPTVQGRPVFLGSYGFDHQAQIIGHAIDVFAQAMGRKPNCFTPGYASANDHTFPALEALGLSHGCVSMPLRNIPRCACVWGDSPLEVHYPHRYNRCLKGDVDFVDVPLTVDTESPVPDGKERHDLRIERGAAEQHRHIIHMNVVRQVAAADSIPVKHIKVLTHNVFDYLDSKNPRREAFFKMIAAAQRICEDQNVNLIPATTADIAATFRQRVPLKKEAEPTMPDQD